MPKTKKVKKQDDGERSSSSEVETEQLKEKRKIAKPKVCSESSGSSEDSSPSSSSTTSSTTSEESDNENVKKSQKKNLNAAKKTSPRHSRRASRSPEKQKSTESGHKSREKSKRDSPEKQKKLDNREHRSISRSRHRNRSGSRSGRKKHSESPAEEPRRSDHRKDRTRDRNDREYERSGHRDRRDDHRDRKDDRSYNRDYRDERNHDRDQRNSRRSSRSPHYDRRDNNRKHRRYSKDDSGKSYEWGKRSDEKPKDDKPVEKEKPNFGLSGALLEDTNKVNGVIVKYSEPPEARKPKRRWRLYPFKGETALPILHIHRQSCFLVGRDRKVVDLPVDHPSCSKQHAALQYRLVPFERDDGSSGKRVRLYLIDLESANGTFINGSKIEPKKYYELIEKDVIKFGFSTREYVLLHENSKEDQEDDDVHVKTEEDDIPSGPNP